MTPEQRRARAYAAQALMNDPTIQEGWDVLVAELEEKWVRCWFPRSRDRIWAQLRHIKALRGQLAAYAAQARD